MCKCVSAKGYRRIRTVQIRSKGQDRISSIMNPRMLRAVRSGLMAQIQSVEGVSLYLICTAHLPSNGYFSPNSSSNPDRSSQNPRHWCRLPPALTGHRTPNSLRRRTHRRGANPRKTTPNPNSCYSDHVETTTNMIRVSIWVFVLGHALATARRAKGGTNPNPDEHLVSDRAQRGPCLIVLEVRYKTR